MDGDIDTTNRCLVGIQGDDILIMNPQRRLTKEQALVLAAYIVSMIGDEQAWLNVLATVESI